MGIEIIIILLLIVLNGVFAMTELALTTAKKSRLSHDAKNGSKRARVALELINEPNRFLSTVQIGITLIGILTGVFGGDMVADDIKAILNQFSALREYSDSLSIFIVVGSITFLTLIIGEIVPKRIGLAYSEIIAKLLARPMHLLSLIARPVIWVLSISTEITLKILRVKEPEDNVTEAEIKEMIAQATKIGNIEKVEKDIVERTFRLSDKKISEIMIKKSDIIWLNLNKPLLQNKERILNNVHRLYPVRENNSGKILGTIHIKEILLALLTNEPAGNLIKNLSPVIYVSQDFGSYHVFNIFKDKKASMALVTDKKGTIRGLVTLDDLVDELIGEIEEAYIYEEPVIKRGDGSWYVDAAMPLEHFAKYFKIPDEIYIESSAEYLAGFISLNLDESPVTGAKFSQYGYSFEIADMDGSKIDKILLEKL